MIDEIDAIWSKTSFDGTKKSRGCAEISGAEA
jgi:hypothetical protein